MFENSASDSFERSDVYFTIIELLRIAKEWINSLEDSIRKTEDKIDRSLIWGPFMKFTGDMEDYRRSRKIIAENWRVVWRKYKSIKDELLEKIDVKMVEVKSLRDGVSGIILSFHVR
jgi:hypothetical protein